MKLGSGVLLSDPVLDGALLGSLLLDGMLANGLR